MLADFYHGRIIKTTLAKHFVSVSGCPAGELLADFVPLSCMFAVWQAGGTTGLLMDLAANKEAVHASSGFLCTHTHLCLYWNQKIK